MAAASPPPPYFFVILASASRIAAWLTPNWRAITVSLMPAPSDARIARSLAVVSGAGPRSGSRELGVVLDFDEELALLRTTGGAGVATGGFRLSNSAATEVASCLRSASVK